MAVKGYSVNYIGVLLGEDLLVLSNFFVNFYSYNFLPIINFAFLFSALRIDYPYLSCLFLANSN
jgi:hypothetical protein